jgi:hypothetical protein
VIVYDTEIQNSRSERQSPRFVSGVCTLPSLYSFALCAFSIYPFLKFGIGIGWSMIFSFSDSWIWDLEFVNISSGKTDE